MLQLENINCFYGAVQVLKDVSFGVAAGEIVGLLGRNGAGKTTTLRTIMGQIKPRSGSIIARRRATIQNSSSSSGW